MHKSYWAWLKPTEKITHYCIILCKSTVCALCLHAHHYAAVFLIRVGKEIKSFCPPQSQKRQERAGGGNWRNSCLKCNRGSNKMFPPAFSQELKFSISTCQAGNLSEAKAIYTGIKCMAESICDVVCIESLLLWKSGQVNRHGGECKFTLWFMWPSS